MPNSSQPRFSVNDMRHWRERANLARSRAQALRDGQERRMMFVIADQYDFLADGAERLRGRELTRMLCDFKRR